MKAMMFPPSPGVERRVARGPASHRSGLEVAQRASLDSSVAQRVPISLTPPSARRRSIVSLLTGTLHYTLECTVRKC